jgi:hypothetical protein
MPAVAAAVLTAAAALSACGSAATGMNTAISSGSPTVTSHKSGDPRILIVGDSITNGILGDYTWRYRLWQDLSGTNAQFVGHRTGTENIYDDPVDVASVNGQHGPADNYANPTDGYYNSSVEPLFLRGGDHHDALWGWTYFYAKEYVAQDVSAYHPGYLLIELGFDDLAWRGSKPSTMLADAKILVGSVRAVDPAIRILIANVVTRTPLPNLPHLNANIEEYNAGLAAAVPGWSTARSPVKLVNVSSIYNPSSDSYDGLHPNGEGEYVIADAFADVLARDFGLGHVPGPPPSSVPGITLTTPASLNAVTSASAVLLRWSHVYGATYYRVFKRDVTGNPSPLPAFSELPEILPGDHWYAALGTAGHTYQYEVAAVRGSSESGLSTPVKVTVPS